VAGRNILLIEPNYRNKYPPLGLMKIAQYHGPRGKKDNVRFIKGEEKSVLDTGWDRIYVATLFSFEFDRTAAAIDFAVKAANGQRDKVFVGGIAASLAHDRFTSERRWHGIRFIKGLLDKAPAVSLRLDDFAEELYSDDRDGTPIEDLVPDYGILEQVKYRYPVRDGYFGYASRGCIRKCHFCGVPILEGSQRDARPLTSLVTAVDELYGPKRDLILMDNNITASARFREIIAEIRDLGFTPGAKLKREHERVASLRRVDFNQGVDARILSKDRMYMQELASICLSPLRIAFDHMGLREPYEKSVRLAHEFGLKELSNYMLFNFHDSPSDLFGRMRMNVRLNEELGIRIWSFPMRYQPVDRTDRNHVGDKWTRYQLRSMQIILQATHGIVSGNPEFFVRAFGNTSAEYEEILFMPHDFIFFRDWFETGGGRGAREEFAAEARRLSPTDRSELLRLLSGCTPSGIAGLTALTANPAVRRILPYYVPMSKDECDRKTKELRLAKTTKPPLPPEEMVEDAGLDDDAGRIAA
jgi:hypothetical protein